MESLKHFLVGASWPVFILFFMSVLKIKPEIRNYRYETYTLVAPVYLGLMNVIGKMFFKEKQYLYTGLMSGSIVAIIATLLKSYNFTTMKEWIRYYVSVVLRHLIAHFVIIQNLELLIKKING